MDSAEIQIISNHFENLFANKMENAEERDKFLGIHELLKLNQDDIKS